MAGGLTCREGGIGDLFTVLVALDRPCALVIVVVGTLVDVLDDVLGTVVVL